MRLLLLALVLCVGCFHDPTAAEYMQSHLPADAVVKELHGENTSYYWMIYEWKGQKFFYVGQYGRIVSVTPLEEK